MNGPATEIERCLGDALRGAARSLRIDLEYDIENATEPDGSYDDPGTEAILAAREEEIAGYEELLAEIDMERECPP